MERATINLKDNTFFLHIPTSGPVDSDGRLMHITRNEVIIDITGKELSDEAEGYALLGFYDENASFFNDVRKGKMPLGDIRSALQSVDIADCIRRRMSEYYR